MRKDYNGMQSAEQPRRRRGVRSEAGTAIIDRAIIRRSWKKSRELAQPNVSSRVKFKVLSPVSTAPEQFNNLYSVMSC